MKKKVLILASVASMIDQFNMQNINILQELGYEVHVACNFEKGSTCNKEKIVELKKKLDNLSVKYFQIDFSRNVYNLIEVRKAYVQVKDLLIKEKYEFIHCHSPIGGVCGRIAAHKTKIKVIYTAHGFHFFKGAPITNWLVFYPIEKFLARWTDVLITINKEDYERAKNKFKAGKVEYVPGVGIDVDKFANVSEKEEYRKKIRDMYNIPDDATVILSVGELNSNKNHETILKAILNIKNDNIYYIICGIGDKKERLEQISRDGKYPRLILPGFCKNVIEYYYAADIFAFPSKREGLGLAALEAMACGLPLITSNVHGINDYSVDGETGFSCKPNDVIDFSRGIEKCVKKFKCSNDFGKENVIIEKKYDVENVNKLTKKIYSEIM